MASHEHVLTGEVPTLTADMKVGDTIVVEPQNQEGNFDYYKVVEERGDRVIKTYTNSTSS